METLLQDIRFALRMLRKSPGFTAVAILTLALGIGANTTIFTLIKAVFLQSVPVQEPARVVVLFGTSDRDKTQFDGISVPNLSDYRSNVNAFSATSLLFGTELALEISGKTTPVFAQLVNWDFFNAVGVQPSIGRGFAMTEDRGPHAAVVLSDRLWREQFGARRDIVGQAIRLDAQDFNVVGIMPPEFHDVGAIGTADAWIPESMHDQVLSGLPKEWFTRRQSMMGIGIARLKPGVTLSQAQQAVEAVAAQLERDYPDDNTGRRVTLIPIEETMIPIGQRSTYERAGALMMLVVGLVLLIACANVANLLLARATERRREVAIRLSLGASRRRLIRQMLTESLMLGLVGAAIAILFAKWTRPALFWLLPRGTSNLDVSLDLRVFGFTLGLSLLATILFGLLPAVQISNPRRVSSLQDRTGAPSGSNRWYGLRNVLVMAQVAFSLIALNGAALFIHSLQNAREVDPGFDVNHSMLLFIDTTAQRFTQARAEQFYTQAVERVRALPGVAAASLVDTPPLSGGLGTIAFKENADASDERNGEPTGLVRTAPGYFSAAGISMLRGRDFTEHDDADSEKVLVVNQALANIFWPNQDPLGKQVRFYKRPWIFSVVGVVRTVKYTSLGEPPQPVVYMPLKQLFNPQVLLWARSSGNVNGTLPTVRAAVQSLDPTMQLIFVSTVQKVVDDNLTDARLGAELLTAFGLLALILAAVGACGVTYYAVSQRTHEIGIRMALGARPGDVLRLILGSAMAAVIVGVGAGLPASIFLARSVSGLLYGIGMVDLPAFGATSGVLIVVAFIACLFPAARAMRVDPMVALRYE